MTIANASISRSKRCRFRRRTRGGAARKLRKIQELGVDPWGGDSTITRRSAKSGSRESRNRLLASGRRASNMAQQHGPRVRAAGRIVLMRDTGKLIFADIRDWTGQIQLFIGKKQVGDENWALAQCFDLGDIDRRRWRAEAHARRAS